MSRHFYFTIKTGKGIEVTLLKINIQCSDFPVTYWADIMKCIVLHIFNRQKRGGGLKGIITEYYLFNIAF